jgi:hypothetical protein
MRIENLVRAYRWADTRRRQLLTVVNGCFGGVWLGLLDRPALERLDELFYSHGRDVLDGRAFTYAADEHNLSGLRGWEETAIESHFPAGARVAVTGAGGGREVIALLERGFDAVGYEPNEALVAAGSELMRRLGKPDRLRACARHEFPADASPCDALVVGWGSYMLIPGRSRRIAFLRAARRALPEGAPMLCSFFVRRPRDPYFAMVVATANVFRRLRRTEGAELGDAIGHNFVHSFTRAEIESELAQGGFRMVAFAAAPYGNAVAVAAPCPEPPAPVSRR